jgi:hypothetical protein
MLIVRKLVLGGCLSLALIAALTYAGDAFWARRRGVPTEQMRVDRVYAFTNHWNKVDYSVGTPIMQTCLDALWPHFGYVPCWYLRRHTFQQIGDP